MWRSISMGGHWRTDHHTRNEWPEAKGHAKGMVRLSRQYEEFACSRVFTGAILWGGCHTARSYRGRAQNGQFTENAGDRRHRTGPETVRRHLEVKQRASVTQAPV